MVKNYRNMILTMLLFASSLIFAQGSKITGSVTDAATGEKLIGASVVITSLGTGAATNVEGMFSIENVQNGTFAVTVSYIGYLSKTINIKIAGDVKVDFALQPSSVLLNETVVKSTRAVLRETPVAFSEVSGLEIESKLASRDLPMVLASTPSVYATLGGGGAGDANMVVRGFDQKNIAVMINGVPVNDMEGKTVYWSNWAGLGDVTESAQILRGLGYTPYSVSAVGGVVNVRTKGVGSLENSYKLRAEMGSWGLSKMSVAFNQKIGSNFGVTGLLSRKTQDGYAVATYLQEWTYYLAVGGVFGNHSLELQFVGSPQEHGQRSSSTSIANWDKYGKAYNPNVGRLQGGFYNEYINKYHKPAFNLNWNWQMNKISTLSTVFYYSPGRGWGSGYLGTAATVLATGEFAGYKDYDAVWNKNSSNIDATYSTAAYGTLGQFRTVTGNYIRWNSHNWFGLVSNYKTLLDPTLTLTAGIDARYYIGMHYGEVRDLIGGDYWVDKYVNGTGGDINNPLKIARVGDVVTYNYEGHVRNLGGFGQLEYKSGSITAFVNVSAATVGQQREDFFNYTPNDPLRKTAWVNFLGYTGKTGINYNINDNHSVYANIGYFSTPPTLSNVFVGYNSILANTQYKNTTNEKVLGLELGYQYSTPEILVKINGFYTRWQDRAFTTSKTDPATGAAIYTNIVGATQLHQGVELEAAYKIMRGLEFRLTGSLQNNKYMNDVNAIVSSESGAVLANIVSYIDGLYVYGFPQQQVTASLNYNLNLGYGINVFVNPEYRFNGRQFSTFNADTRTNINDRAQSWRLPDYGMVDLHFGADMYFSDFMIKKINLALHIFNLLDYKDYITYASDGSDHSTAKVYVFYGRPRWLNLSLVVGF